MRWKSHICLMQCLLLLAALFQMLGMGLSLYTEGFCMEPQESVHNGIENNKKSARIVGEVIGKYHPHGDQSIYDSLVRMAQPWSLRYLLIDGRATLGLLMEMELPR